MQKLRKRVCMCVCGGGGGGEGGGDACGNKSVQRKTFSVFPIKYTRNYRGGEGRGKGGRGLWAAPPSPPLSLFCLSVLNYLVCRLIYNQKTRASSPHICSLCCSSSLVHSSS